MNTTPAMPDAPVRTVLHPAAEAADFAVPANGDWHEQAWAQVLARNAAADGTFVYAVRSTGIFCRPSCPSRRPLRSRVIFFRSAAQAGESGFRACLRCRPEAPSNAECERDRAVVEAVVRALERCEGEPLDLGGLSAATGEARSAILRAFRRVLGTTPARFQRERRMAGFRQAMQQPEGRSASITESIYEAGFGSSSRLYEASGATLGMTPSALRAGAAGETIRYTIADSPLGRTLVAATERGVCAISFADTDEALREELRGRFSKAELREVLSVVADRAVEPGDAGEGETRADQVSTWLLAAVQFVLGQLSESPTAAAFPLDVRATAFQQRVWRALAAIPRGSRVSYGELARQLGQPSGARAVASACARNPVALLIPCHRVVGDTGAMAGYRWGVQRKRQLLAAEQGAGGAAEHTQGQTGGAEPTAAGPGSRKAPTTAG